MCFCLYDFGWGDGDFGAADVASEVGVVRDVEDGSVVAGEGVFELFDTW